MRRIKKLYLTQQREIFTSLSVEQLNRLPRPDILEEYIKLENNTILRHYQPKKSSNKDVLFIHGGGWCLGSISTYDHVCRYLCDQGK
ncbi:pimeloyl-ACP methyl ester esterase BioJ, partial [Francisella tularensis subsp. holarctica]|nr:pimeloyl-ACP methyl ester esterase BioJ [Francisella tularensis subsp. holarctica]